MIDLLDLPYDAPIAPKQIAGLYGSFMTPLNVVAVAGKITYAGVKILTQWGGIIWGVKLVNQDTIAAHVFDVRVGQQLDAGLVAGIRLRNTGLDRDGNPRWATAQAFVAQNTTVNGNSMHRERLPIGTTSPFIDLSYFLNQNDELIFCSEDQNSASAGTIYGVEFYGPEARDYFLERLK